MEFNQIIELIKTISDSKVTSFTLEEGDKKLTIKAGDKQPQVIQVPQQMPAMPPMAPMQAPVMPPMAHVQSPVMSQMASVQSQAMSDMAASQPTVEAQDDNAKAVTSPLVGTFYSAPSPDAEPFVRVGDTVKRGH